MFPYQNFICLLCIHGSWYWYFISKGPKECAWSSTSFLWACLLGPAPTGTGTIALDPTFGSFTLLKSVSHYMNWFLSWNCWCCCCWLLFLSQFSSVYKSCGHTLNLDLFYPPVCFGFRKAHWKKSGLWGSKISTKKNKAGYSLRVFFTSEFCCSLPQNTKYWASCFFVLLFLWLKQFPSGVTSDLCLAH